MKSSLALAVAAITLFTVGSCSAVDPVETALSLAQKGGFTGQDVNAGRFTLRTYGRVDEPGAPLTVYIEGDGFAWATRYQVSEDPTPHDPIALKLASIDPQSNVVYIARPCQYVLTTVPRGCHPAYWTNDRFAPEVVESVSLAVDHWKNRSKAQTIQLVGFSGGGAVAVLVAANRSDVGNIRTVAGNLDHVTLNRLHGADPLTGSLNAADVADKLAKVPQIHFLGLDDTVVTREVINGYLGKIHDRSCIRVHSIAGAAHQSGWDIRWQHLLHEQFADCKKQL